MEKSERKNHWENIYQTKELKDVSWYQSTPETSLGLIKELNLPANAKIIDIGGGDSFLVDYLLNLGYKDITILDVSENAIERAKLRLGDRAANVKWIITDVIDFEPDEKYDLWHDRAAFHFLNEENEILKYIETASQNINSLGALIIATFSELGPKKCSGIEIRQYTEDAINERFTTYFEKTKCIKLDHKTPFDTIQNFIFCRFKKKDNN